MIASPKGRSSRKFPVDRFFKFFLQSDNELFVLEIIIIVIKVTIEWFSIECRKTKTKVITLANHKEHRQYSEPIKTRSNYR